MADARVDILLALKTQLEGNEEALAYLDGFGNATTQNAHRIGDEWEKMQRKLERKFSLPDIGYELLRGFGAGSGFAIIEHSVGSFLDSFKEKAQAAAEVAKTLATEIASVSKGYDELAGKKVANQIEALTPDRRIVANNKRLDEVKAEIAEQQAKYSAAADEIAKAGTTSAALMTFIRGSSQEGNWDHRYKVFNRDEPAIEETNARVATLMSANKRILELENQREDIEKSLATDKKTIAEQNSKLLNDMDKADAEASIAVEKKKSEAIAKAEDKAHTDRVARLKDVLAEESQAYDQLIAGQKTKNDKSEAARKAANRAEIASAIDANQEVMRGYAASLALIDSSPLLSDQEKRAQRVVLLQQENVAIAAQIELWKKFGVEHPELDPATVRGQIRALQDRSVGNISKMAPVQTIDQRNDIALRDMGIGKNDNGTPATIDPSKHYTDASAGIAGSLKAQVAELGTFGDQVNRAFTSVGNTIRTSLGGAFADVILKGGTFRSKLVNFSNAIATSFVTSAAQMAADWIYQHTIMAAFSSLFKAKDVATTSATEGAKSVIVTGGAAARVGAAAGETTATTGLVVTAAGEQSAATGIAGVFRSIMELGPIAGPLVMATSLAAMIALVSALIPREAGGPVSAGQAYLVGEKRPEIFVPNTDGFIIPNVAQAMTKPGYAPSGAGGGSAAGGGSSGRPVNVYPLMANDRAAIETARRDPHADAHFVYMLKRHRRVLPGQS